MTKKRSIRIMKCFPITRMGSVLEQHDFCCRGQLVSHATHYPLDIA